MDVCVVRGIVNTQQQVRKTETGEEIQEEEKSQVSPCEICRGQSGVGTAFCPSTSVFPCQYHSANASPPIHTFIGK
jgi:hypothetical protein